MEFFTSSMVQWHIEVSPFTVEIISVMSSGDFNFGSISIISPRGDSAQLMIEIEPKLKY